MDFEQQIESEREEKNYFFKYYEDSPIPLEERTIFKGLEYFPANPKLRFLVELKEHKEKKTVDVDDSHGGTKKYIRWGEFRFIIDEKEYVLQAYKSDPEEDRLWVPFKDKTNGKDTYGAGRYIDLEPSRHMEDGKWVLDFNQAYNPYCAYSENYVCPFIPPENWLDAEIKAGEKTYKQHENDKKDPISDAEEKLSQIKHPAINSTLKELGIIKEIEIKEKKVKIIVAFPFPNIPIRDQILGSIKNVVDSEGLESEIEETIMTQEEREDFLRKEQENWIG